jgi:hypothetical protein
VLSSEPAKDLLRPVSQSPGAPTARTLSERDGRVIRYRLASDAVAACWHDRSSAARGEVGKASLYRLFPIAG